MNAKTIYAVAFALLLSALVLPSQAMSEKELCDLYLEVIESAVDVYEPIWVDESDRIPNSGFYDFRKYGNWRDEPYATIITISGNGMVSFCYSVLLTETDKEFFGEKKVPRSLLQQRVIQSIRWCCLTSSYVENPYPYLPGTRDDFAHGPNWRREFSWRADEVGWLTMAAAQMGDLLDEETQKAVQAVMIGGAPKERLVQTWYPRQGGNHDQVKQDLSSTMGAAYLYPNHDDHQLYWDIIGGNGIDMVSTLHDFACNETADGKKISDWAQGWNLYQDYAGDHHGWCNVWYGGDLIFEGRSYIEILSHITGIPVPERFTYPGNGYDGVNDWLKIICLPQGEPASVHGNEYDAYYGAGLLGYCYGALIEKDPVSAAFEHQAARLLQRQSQAVRQYDYHRNSWAKAATAFLLHKYLGPGAAPVAYEEAVRSLDGTYHFRWQQNLIHRSVNKWVNFSWGTISAEGKNGLRDGKGVCGFVMPVPQTLGDTEPLVYCHPYSLMGKLDFKGSGEAPERLIESAYTSNQNDRSFSTAGMITGPDVERFYAFFSFEEKPCVMLSRFRAVRDGTLDWSGMPVYFYARKDFTNPSRAIETEQGKSDLYQKSALALDSSWWCVQDQLGLVFMGGNPKVSVERSPGYNWARIPEYRDQCDGVFVSALQGQELKAGQDAIELTAAIYPQTNTEETRTAAGSIEKGKIELPEGWAGIFAPDTQTGIPRYLAVANFTGAETETGLSLTTEAGAPVFSVPTIISGNSGQLILELEPLASFGETASVMIQTEGAGTIQAQKLPGERYKFMPIGMEGVNVTIRDFHDGAKSLVFLNESGERVHEAPCSPNGVHCRLAGPVLMEINGLDADRIAPVADCADVDVREDGRVKVNVIAEDASGIDGVELFCDGVSLGMKNQPPFVWLYHPGKGYHTFKTVVSDNSPAKNQRTSFKRTVWVER